MINYKFIGSNFKYLWIVIYYNRSMYEKKIILVLQDNCINLIVSFLMTFLGEVLNQDFWINLLLKPLLFKVPKMEMPLVQDVMAKFLRLKKWFRWEMCITNDVSPVKNVNGLWTNLLLAMLQMVRTKTISLIYFFRPRLNVIFFNVAISNCYLVLKIRNANSHCEFVCQKTGVKCQFNVIRFQNNHFGLGDALAHSDV